MTTSALIRRLTRVALLLAGLALASPLPAAAQSSRPLTSKIDAILAQRALRQISGTSRVLVEFADTVDVRVFGDAIGRRVTSKLYSADIDNRRLMTMVSDPRVTRVMLDRRAFSTNERTNVATGAALARLENTLTGRNVGVVVIDSGYATYHNDLFRTKTGTSPRLAHFRDFTVPTSGNIVVAQTASDPYGHGTHVAGIIAGNGFDSKGARAGVAPGARIISLRVLDSQGLGHISDVIAAIDYAIEKKAQYNIRVINLSVGAGVFESYANDPLALAARRAVDAGIVVVTAAGNLGQNDEGETQFGGITSPGNAPWVLTVGAASHGGTGFRSDDEVANFSSRGPTWINFSAKPDLLAYGVGTESLAAPGSTLAAEMEDYLLSGSAGSVKPYLSLSGTSMSAPVVAGTIALMLEANPQLTPNAVKAILQYTAEVMTDAHALSQGAGVLNTRGAVRLAKYFKAPTAQYPDMFDVVEDERIQWAQHVIWGNFRVTGGVPLPGSNAWALNQRWGSLSTPTGGSVVWGADFDANIVWSTDTDGNIVWSTNDDSNIVWSTGDAGDDANIVWSTDADGNIVWSTNDDGNIVWSTDDDGNIVWSTIDDQDSNIVWSTAVAQNVVWGNDCGGRNCPKILWGAQRPNSAGVWGTLDDDGNIVWSTDDDGNIVWSTDADGNIVWSTDDYDSNIVWSTNDDGNIVWSTDADGNIVWSTTGFDGNIVWSTDLDGNIVWSTDENDSIVWSAGAQQQVRWPDGY